MAISLIVSWLVAVVFAPLIGKAILKVPKPKADAKPSKLVSVYSAFLRGAIRAKWLTIGLTVAAFAAAIFLARFVPRQFFPASDRPELTVDMTLRQNASIFATEEQAKRFEALLKDNPDVDHYSTYIGRGAIRFILTLNVQLANPFFAQFVIVAKDIDARERLQAKLEQALAEQFPDVVARISPLELGSPGRLAVAVSRDRAGQRPGPPDRPRSRDCDRVRPARAAHQLRLDGARAAGPRPHRPGRGAPARRQLGGDRRGPERRDHRLDGDAGS